jgi:deferrochelatase/peroxidase EfeB
MESAKVAIIPDFLPGEGGSILLFQKWLHEMSSFNQLSTDQQEMEMVEQN